MKITKTLKRAAALAACLILAGAMTVMAQPPEPPADAGPGGPGGRRMDPAQMFDNLDTNKDGNVSKAEFEAGMQNFGNRRRGNNANSDNNQGDFAQRMRENRLERLKEELGATDKEWTILKPRLEKIMELQMAQRGRFGGRGGDNANEPAATADLRKAIENKDTKAEDLQKKLEAFRAEKKKEAAALETARAALKEVLTARQEAVLVLNGMLD